MDSRFKIFFTTASLRSFTKAAEVLSLTQPAITFQIRNLEETLKVRLFNREFNKVTLTTAGRILFRHTEIILGEYEKAKEEIAQVTGRFAGEIRIGVASLLGKYLLPKLIGHYKQNFPDIEIIMLVGNSRHLIQEIKHHMVDLIVVSEPVALHNLVVEPFIEDELMVVVNPRHNWPHRQFIELEDLLKENHVAREYGSGTREVFKNFLTSKNISFKNLKVVMTLGSSEAVKSAVESGVGYGILSRVAVEREIGLGLLRSVKIKDVTLRRRFLVVYQGNHHKAYLLKSFIDFIRS